METGLTFEKVMQGFEEMSQKWLQRADDVVKEYRGCDQRILHMAVNELDKIAIEVVEWMESVDAGHYPKESVTILSSVIKELTERKYEIEVSVYKAPFAISDHSNIPLPDDWSATAN